jgi:glutaryl-CoA dehydrogenase (non-decarboxylating)
LIKNDGDLVLKIELTPEHTSEQSSFRSFVNEEIVPFADQYDQQERIPYELIKKIARRGYLGAIAPKEDGGKGMDMITFGLLNEELGRGSSCLRSLLTVHSMVAQTILRWGSPQQRTRWARRLATGECIAAFGLTEPNAGSDARSIETTATISGDTYVLNGKKKWITFGQIADLFLVFAQCEGEPAAFLVEKECRGLSSEPIVNMLGVRASMLAELSLKDCHVPRENLIGKPGFGFSHIAASALDCGRYSVAWGCLGLAQACLEASVRYAAERKQFGSRLIEYQLIQRMITDMITNVKATRLLCLHAGRLRDIKDPAAFMETSIAKYFASLTASKASSDAVQIHGANGCSGEYSVQRYFRDAKIMEIIEGSTQMHQIDIARRCYHDYLL